MSITNLNEKDRVISREFVHHSSEMRCNTIHFITDELICENLTETMIQFKNSTYCSNHAKSLKRIVEADDVEKIEVKPSFICPAKSCTAKLTFKMFWTNSCCAAAIRKHLMEVDSLLEPAEEKLKKSEQELARIDKLQSDTLVELQKMRNQALKRKNEDKEDVDTIKAAKRRIVETTVFARYLCENTSCKKEFSLNYKTNKNIECVLRCGHSLCLECVERGIKTGVNVCPVEGCTRTFTKTTFTRKK